MNDRSFPTLRYCALAAILMAYGWGYRGTVGHEGGAMVPGTMLGLVLALASGRLDWQRRAVVIGLFAAVGWAWGGSLSYMEQTMYVQSDSFPDVLYGYTMLFFLGALWAGIGGGVLGLAVTEPRSELERFVRPFVAMCAAFLAVYVFFVFNPDLKETNETFTVMHFHDGDWLAAVLALAVSAIYWVVRPKDRPTTALFLWGALAWWVGYLSLTKFGGLRLGPLHRSENWGGVLGILVVLIVVLRKRENRAALMLCRYGILGGGLAFATAVFLRHPILSEWGPFEGVRGWPSWRTAEDSFGFLMGLAISLGGLRLIRGGLRPAEEDKARSPLDVFAVFVILVALIWINFRRHAAPWLREYATQEPQAFLGIPLWGWYVVCGGLATLPVLYALLQYHRGDRALAPRTAFGKGAWVTLALVWLTVTGYILHEIPQTSTILGYLILWIPATLASLLLLSFSPASISAEIPTDAITAPNDPRWNPSARYWLLSAAVPLVLIAFTLASMGMQEDRPGMGRKRFGPDAYWRQTARLLGTWKAVALAGKLDDPGTVVEDLPVSSLEFTSNRDVIETLPSGETVAGAHRWFLKNQYTWLDWNSKLEGKTDKAEVPLEFRGDRLYIAWPVGGSPGFVVFEKAEE